MTEERFLRCVLGMNEGDRDALREVYEEYVSYIYGIVLQLLKNKENAEDITADFFIRLWEKSALYKPGSGHKGWMATIARNMAVDFIRKNKREDLVEDFEEGEFVANTAAASTQVSVERQVVGDITVQEALETLNEKERLVVHMKVLGGMTLQEIADALETPMGTIAWRYREAVNKLRRLGYGEGL